MRIRFPASEQRKLAEAYAGTYVNVAAIYDRKDPDAARGGRLGALRKPYDVLPIKIRKSTASPRELRYDVDDLEQTEN